MRDFPRAYESEGEEELDELDEPLPDDIGLEEEFEVPFAEGRGGGVEDWRGRPCCSCCSSFSAIELTIFSQWRTRLSISPDLDLTNNPI